MRPPPNWFVRPLQMGDQGEDVRTVQLLLRCEVTGVYDEPTAAKVRGLRTLHGLPRSSSVDQAVATHLGELR